jgi:hypothetical protein
MRARIATALAAISCMALATGSHAATAKPQIVDPKGDANAVNGQGFLIGGPTASSPASVAAADITGVTFATTFKRIHRVRTATGFTVKMTLAAAPTGNFMYRVTAVGAGCDDLFFEYTTGGTAVRCPATPPKPDIDYDAPDAKVKGTSITWTIPSTAIRLKSKFTDLEGTTRVLAVVVTAPQVDDAYTDGATFTVGK